MKTVLHIADYSAPYSGNFIAETRAFAGGSRQLGLKSATAVPARAKSCDWANLLRKDGIGVHLIPEPRRYVAAAQAISEIIRAEDVVILHCHFNRRYEIASAMARHLSGRRNIGLIWHRRSDGPFHPTLSSTVKNFIANRVLARDKCVITVSEQLRQQAIASGVRPEQVTTVFNGVDVARATTPSKSRNEVRADWGVPPDVPVILHFGWNPVIKGLDLLLAAAQRLARSKMRFMIVSVGWEATVEAAGKALAGIKPEWLRIVTPVENVADLYQAADLMVSTSRYEGFSGCVAEAMSAGLPVLATDIPGVRWAAASCGVRFAAVSAASIARELEFMLGACSQERRKWLEANRSLIRRKYTHEHLTAKVCELYASLWNSQSETFGLEARHEPVA